MRRRAIEATHCTLSRVYEYLDKLDEIGVYDQSLIFVVGDHGQSRSPLEMSAATPAIPANSETGDTHCVNCHFENPEGIKFCGNCGAPQESLCSSCGFKNPPGFKFCGNCGTQILQNQGPALPQKPVTKPRPEKRAEAERRHLTVMFCDLVGSTALSSELDPEDLREIITEYQGVCQKVVARYEGHIAQYLGDGILVYFGYPAAHENDAHRAVSSGLGILEAVQQFNKRLEKSNGIRISVRIGIHTGHVVIGDMGSTGQTQQLALGATPNIAARLQGLAEPDTLIISADTYALVKRFFLCEDKGEHQVKGIPTPIKVYRVIHENVARSRFEASQDVSDQVTLVGRDDEVDQLVGLWEDAKQSKSHVVLLSGEPGVGKSRVLQALMSHVAARRQIRRPAPTPPELRGTLPARVALDATEPARRVVCNTPVDIKLNHEISHIGMLLIGESDAAERGRRSLKSAHLVPGDIADGLRQILKLL